MREITLTNKGMSELKGLIEVAEQAANDIHEYMVATGLDKVSGTCIRIEVNPQYDTLTKTIEFGGIGRSIGYLKVVGGKDEKGFNICNGGNTAEYEVLFADEDTKQRIKKYLDQEKALPPDGMWLGVDDDNPILDCGRDIDDTVANC